MFLIELIFVFVLLIAGASFFYLASKDHEKGYPYNKNQILYICLGIICLIVGFVLSIYSIFTTVANLFHG